ncbi:MAG: type VI secretion system tip protein TssI/VgrG [Polyangiaceae bacterium]
MATANPYTLTVDGFDEDTFTVQSFEGQEAMSDAYSFRVVALASGAEELERTTLGASAVFTWSIEGRVRAFYGVIASIRSSGTRDDRAVEYRLHFVPRLWLLKRKRRSRIFQRVRVVDVVTQVLLEAGIAARWQLTKSYSVRDYCTQYEETDYAFVKRLLAEAGIYFYFAEGGPVTSGLRTMSTVAGAVGGLGGTAVGKLAGPAAGAAVTSVASAASPLLPGDSVICGDDTAFYPPLGPDDPAALEVASAAAFVPEVSGEASAVAGSVVAALASHPAPPLEYLTMLGATISRADKVTQFDVGTSVRPSAAEFRDYDPERPMTKLASRAVSVAPFPESGLEVLADAASQAGKVAGSAATGIGGDVASAVADDAGAVVNALEGVMGEHAPPYLEIYDHHGPFLFPKWTTPSDEAPRMLRQARRRASLARGTSGCPELAPGHKFALTGHPIARLDQPYVVTWAEHRGRSHPEHEGSERFVVYENAFACAPATMPFVPAKPKRRSVQVALTAVVVGPSGTEIHVDPMGQIKVQFHWDREGKNDENSSCWIRTMHPWGGAGWGVQFIPRVGMEVVVVFEGGDPDKPLVIGSVYNAIHPSPFPLPQDKTRSGWRTQSSPGGVGFNELSFEDASGNEQIYVHAQKDFDEVVRHNHTLRVENDELIRVLGKRLDTIEKNLEERVMGDRTSAVDGNRLDVVSGNADLRVTGMRATRIEGREQRDVHGASESVYASDLTVRVLGCSTTIVGTNDKRRSWTTHAEGSAALSGLDKVEISSDSEIVLRVGDSSVRISKKGIELSSSSITTQGESGKLAVDKDGVALASSDAKMTMGDKLVMKSTSASVVLDKDMQLDGEKILLNSPEMASDAPPKEPAPPTKISLSDQDGRAIAFQRFVAKLDDGSEVSGKTDADGKAELELSTGGKIVFADLTFADEPAGGDLQPYVVRQGDYLDKLAFVYGFDADKVWSDGKNSDLKEKRKVPNLLHPGDVVYFPRGPRKGLDLQKGTSNDYTATVPKTKVRIKFVELTNAPYVVEGLGAKIEGTTDQEGMAAFEVPVHVREVQVLFPKANLKFPVMIGDMDPVDEASGARKRLQHLGHQGYPAADASESDVEAADREALLAFQKARGLEQTGELDDATKAAIVREHGS